MKVYDFVDEGLGHSSYVVDLGDGTAAVVDPPRFPVAHEALADQLRLRIGWTLDTHSHADYVTGSPALAARKDITFIAPDASHLVTPHRPVHDREQLDLAPGVELIALATPGHTPDHFAYLLAERGTPVALFSGGSLMVGAIGRTDLCGPELAEPLAHEMFHSLRRFDELPPNVAVYPTHGAGSFCSAPGGSQRISTIRHERTENHLFAIREEENFVAQLVAGFGTFPSYFAELPELNRLGPTRYDTIPQLERVSAADLEHHVDTGGIVIDARSVAAFSVGHIPGSISITLRPVFASWVGWLVASDRSIAFVLDADQDRDDLVRQCLDVGHEQLVGELAGGIDAWATSGRATATIPVIDSAGMSGRVIDVRQANEYESGHLPDATNVELGKIPTADFAAGPLTLMCGHGERAMTAASLIARRGRTDVVAFDGGPETWSTSTGSSLVTGR